MEIKIEIKFKSIRLFEIRLIVQRSYYLSLLQRLFVKCYKNICLLLFVSECLNACHIQ